MLIVTYPGINKTMELNFEHVYFNHQNIKSNFALFIPNVNLYAVVTSTKYLYLEVR